MMIMFVSVIDLDYVGFWNGYSLFLPIETCVVLLISDVILFEMLYLLLMIVFLIWLIWLS